MSLEGRAEEGTHYFLARCPADNQWVAWMVLWLLNRAYARGTFQGYLTTPTRHLSGIEIWPQAINRFHALFIAGICETIVGLLGMPSGLYLSLRTRVDGMREDFLPKTLCMISRYFLTGHCVTSKKRASLLQHDEWYQDEEISWEDERGDELEGR